MDKVKETMNSTNSLVRPIAECKEDDLLRGHAFVYGSAIVIDPPIGDAPPSFRTTNPTWWCGLHYQQYGPPSIPGSWLPELSQGRIHQLNVTHFMIMPDMDEVGVDGVSAAGAFG